MVINYDFERQVGAVQSAGRRLQGIEVKAALKTLLRYLLIIAGVAGVCAVLLYRKRLFPSREERLLRAFYRRVGQDLSLKVERGRVGLFELADRTGNPGVRLFAETYAGAVYRDRKLTDDEYRQLRQMVRAGFREAAV